MYPEAPLPLPFPYRPTISLFDFTHYILYNLAVLPIMGIFTSRTAASLNATRHYATFHATVGTDQLNVEFSGLGFIIGSSILLLQKLHSGLWVSVFLRGDSRSRGRWIDRK